MATAAIAGLESVGLASAAVRNPGLLAAFYPGLCGALCRAVAQPNGGASVPTLLCQ